jgi:hypothetical protein
MAERLEWREAIAALDDMRPVAATRLLDPLGEGGAALTPGERRWLERSAARLEDRIVSLVRSRRPDRGRALLVAVARHRAFRRSLAEGRFWTLDPFDDDASSLDPGATRARRRALDALARDFAAANRGRREGAATGEIAPDEPGWQRLEEAAARHQELARAVRDGTPLRLAPSPLIPWPGAEVRAPQVAGSLPEARQRVRRNLARVRRSLVRLDGYDLLEFNCATELAHALEAPFGARAETVLGGRLEAGRGLAFIPARLFDRAARRLRAGPPSRVPSYRERRLARMRAQENDGWVFLRESNTWTAHSYDGSSRDGHFLLFSDQTWTLRPLAGIVNLAYGSAHTVAGLLTWPVDGGRRLLRGARGVFYSVPEIAFVGLRKGSYEYTEEVGARLVGAAPSRSRAVGESGVLPDSGAVESQRSASSRVTPYQ